MSSDREQTRAEGLVFQFSRLSDREKIEFAETVQREARMISGQSAQSAPSTIMGTGEKARAANMGLEGYSSQELGLDNIEDAMRYVPWHQGQVENGEQVREALIFAAKVILRNVPHSPRRTLALQHLISARMDANCAISFGGRF